MTPTANSRRSTLAKARGLGASGSGTGAFFLSRLTWLASILVTVAMLIVLLSNAGGDYAAMRAGLGGFGPTMVLTLFVAVTFYHFTLEMQEVIEDYVHHHGLARALMLLIRFSFVVLGLGSILMILRNFFGA